MDVALEWSEEMMLNERKADAVSRLGGIDARATSTPSAPSPFFLPSATMQTPEAILEDPSPADVGENHPLERWVDGAADGERGGGGAGTGDDSSVSPALASSSNVENAMFFGEHEDYYARAGQLRRRSSVDSRIAQAGAWFGLSSFFQK